MIDIDCLIEMLSNNPFILTALILWRKTIKILVLENQNPLIYLSLVLGRNYISKGSQ